ncbi:MAG: Holliday junction branch migration protein RuvA [Firmicutes bacterium]|nr:Holliday junction branch migration protein RuvA [Bacillota bacterium]
MIAFLSGQLVCVEPGGIILDVGGVGYRVWAPSSTISLMPASGEAVKLFTRLLIKDDEMQLYGFASQEELSLFRNLISVSGVGPKGALAILSSFSAATFRSAVAEENITLLSKAPGVGKKTARRIVLELKDKLGPPEPLQEKRLDGVSSAGEEAVSALISLGYRQAEAKNAVARVHDQKGMNVQLEEIIKLSLKFLDHV